MKKTVEDMEAKKTSQQKNKINPNWGETRNEKCRNSNENLSGTEKEFQTLKTR